MHLHRRARSSSITCGANRSDDYKGYNTINNRVGTHISHVPIELVRSDRLRSIAGAMSGSSTLLPTAVHRSSESLWAHAIGLLCTDARKFTASSETRPRTYRTHLETIQGYTFAPGKHHPRQQSLALVAAACTSKPRGRGIVYHPVSCTFDATDSSVHVNTAAQHA